MTQEIPIRPKTASDATEVVYETRNGTVVREVFEPVETTDATHERIEYTWSGCSWRRNGSEFVELIDAPVDTRGDGE